MESYRQMYEKAGKAGQIKNLTPVYREWGKAGDTIIGSYIGKSSVMGRLGGQSYFQYLLDTDEGLIKLSLGKATDNEVAESFCKGVVYAITFNGKEKIAGGRTVNKFTIEEIGGSPEVSEAQGEG